jgi:hypothetical protein
MPAKNPVKSTVPDGVCNPVPRSAGVTFLCCAGRGLQPRPPLRGGNVFIVPTFRVGMPDISGATAPRPR